MPVALNSKDLATLDQKLAADSQVFELLKGGAKAVTSADFVGVKEVRVNTMTGFTASTYKRNGDNSRAKLDISKKTLELMQERWMAYDLDVLDTEENFANTVANAVEEHTRLVAIPEKDKTAVTALATNAGKIVEEDITEDNALSVFDEAEQYMTDTEVIGPFIMFASSAYYKALKNSPKVSKTFTTNEVNLSGINRKVATLDNDIPIVKVAKSRLQVLKDGAINFILVPLNVAMPIEKYNSVDVIDASTDRDGYRTTVKGLDYYDVLVLENAKPAIYMSKAKTAAKKTTMAV